MEQVEGCAPIDPVTAVALHPTPEAIIQATVDSAREELQTDVTLGAVPTERGTYDICVLNGAHEERLRNIHVAPDVGLGGQVLRSGRPLALDDYPHAPDITSEFKSIVAADGIEGIACVPAVSPAGVEFLLYAGNRGYGAPGEAVVERLREYARAAAIGIHHANLRERDTQLIIARERQRLATRLHDSVAQSLFAIGVEARRFAGCDDVGALAEGLAEIESTAGRARSELRDTLARLSECPDGISFEALVAAEMRLLERVSGLRPVFTRRGERRPLTDDAEELVLDALREGLRNVIKHACGATVIVHLGYLTDRVLLSIQCEADVPNGCGDVVAGSGLGMLRQRAHRLGGTLELVARDGRIAVLRVDIPAP
ncbi:MAG: hypothetical protein QOF76_4430 [Solirubrobacteraceae bacterium]|jgi:signal transduction histidine kinase|nr:hypothetical protein [Solirubrobacteraceae bacterium]